MLILSRSVNKHGHPRQFFFLFCRFLKFYSSATTWTNKAKVDILHSHFTTQYSPEVLLSRNLPMAEEFHWSVRNNCRTFLTNLSRIAKIHLQKCWKWWYIPITNTSSFTIHHSVLSHWGIVILVEHVKLFGTTYSIESINIYVLCISE